jgi:hypothetical protein
MGIKPWPSSSWPIVIQTETSDANSPVFFSNGWMANEKRHACGTLSLMFYGRSQTIITDHFGNVEATSEQRRETKNYIILLFHSTGNVNGRRGICNFNHRRPRFLGYDRLRLVTSLAIRSFLLVIKANPSSEGSSAGAVTSRVRNWRHQHNSVAGLCWDAALLD